jgi:serine/threonine-protein kinase SRK2
MVQGLPLPLLKICDFGYSKAHFMSAPKSKVRAAPVQQQGCGGCAAHHAVRLCNSNLHQQR